MRGELALERIVDFSMLQPVLLKIVYRFHFVMRNPINMVARILCMLLYISVGTAVGAPLQQEKDQRYAGTFAVGDLKLADLVAYQLSFSPSIGGINVVAELPHTFGSSTVIGMDNSHVPQTVACSCLVVLGLNGFLGFIGTVYEVVSLGIGLMQIVVSLCFISVAFGVMAFDFFENKVVEVISKQSFCFQHGSGATAPRSTARLSKVFGLLCVVAAVFRIGHAVGSDDDVLSSFHDDAIGFADVNARTPLRAMNALGSPGIIDPRIVSKPDSFDGEEGKWGEWSFVFLAYCTGLSQHLGDLMEAALREENPITLEGLTEENKELAKQLMVMLTLLCRKKALRIIRNVRERGNGIEAWRQLGRQVDTGGTTRDLTALTKILQYKFDQKDVLDSLNVWEALISEYDKGKEINRQISSEVKHGVLVCNMPQKIRDHLQINANRIDTYLKAKDEIRAFSINRKSDKDAMEVDALESKVKELEVTIGAMKGGKKGSKHGKGGNVKGKGKEKGDKNNGGKGKSKGKGFDGNCNYCGKYGHGEESCWAKPGNNKSGRPVGALENEAGAEQPAAAVPKAKSIALLAQRTPGGSSGSESWIMGMSSESEKMCAGVFGELPMIDSGSAVTACPLSYGGEKCKPSDPLRLKGVNGTKVEHYGARKVEGKLNTTDGSTGAEINFEVADVSRPVISVYDMSEKGYWTVFPPWHGKAYFQHDVNDSRSYFVQADGAYLLDFCPHDSPCEEESSLLIAPLEPHQEAAFDHAMEPFDPREFESDEEKVDKVVEDPKSLPVPKTPSAEEVRRHELAGHVNYESWCPDCVAGKGKAEQCRKIPPRDGDVPTVVFDWTFLSRKFEDCLEEEGALPVLSGKCTQTKNVFGTVCLMKGRGDPFAVHYFRAWLESLGHSKVVLLHDGERAAESFAIAVKKGCSVEIIPRTRKRGSSASLASGEQVHQTVIGGMRSLKANLERKYDIEIGVEDYIVPWLVKTSAWMYNHFHILPDGSTPFGIVHGRENTEKVCLVGETVMVRLPVESSKRRDKFKSIWRKGVWVAKGDFSGDHIVMTPAGVVASATVHRIPAENQFADKDFFRSCKGLPWNASAGVDDTKLSDLVPKESVGPVGEPVNAEAVPASSDDSSSSSEEEGAAKTPALAPAAATPPAAGPGPSDGALPSSFEVMSDVEIPEASTGVTDAVAEDRDVEIETGVSVKRMRVNALSIVSTTTWIASMSEIEALNVACEQGEDSADLWEVTPVVVEKCLDPVLLKEGRDLEVKNLTDFSAFEWWKLEDAQKMIDEGARWIGSRFEDQVKGDIVRSRWVLQDFARKKSDVGEFFSATPPSIAVRLFHVMAVCFDTPIIYFDLTTAFLHAPETEDIFTCPPEGYGVGGWCWKLRRKVNGRRDGSKEFTEWIAPIIVKHLGFERSVYEPCSFHHQKAEVHWLLFVDDDASTGQFQRNTELIEAVKSFVVMKVSRPLHRDHDQGPVKFLSRWHRWDESGLHIRPVDKFIDQSLEALGLVDANTTTSPASKSLEVCKEDEVPLTEEQAKTFRHVVCKLMHVQEDYIQAQFSIKEASRVLSSPSLGDMMRLKHMVRFLKGCKGVERTFAKPSEELKIITFTDSDWAKCRTTRKSTDMVIVTLNGMPIYNSSKTQVFLAQSSGEAELGGIHRGGVQSLFTRNLLKNFGVTAPIEVCSDSVAGIAMASRLGVGKVRHLDLKQLWIQEHVRSGRLRLRKVAGESNPADIGTKVLDQYTIARHLKTLGFTVFLCAVSLCQVRGHGRRRAKRIAFSAALFTMRACGASTIVFEKECSSSLERFACWVIGVFSCLLCFGFYYLFTNVNNTIGDKGAVIPHNVALPSDSESEHTDTYSVIRSEPANALFVEGSDVYHIGKCRGLNSVRASKLTQRRLCKFCARTSVREHSVA